MVLLSSSAFDVDRPVTRWLVAWALPTLLMVFPGVTLGQETDIQVSTSTNGLHWKPDIAPRGSGFVVVWQAWNGVNYSTSSIRARLVGSQGVPIGTEFAVTVPADGPMTNPRVASWPDGQFVVVWEDYSRGNLRGELFSSDGSVIGSDFQVNTYSTDRQLAPDVAVDANGEFAVVWQSEGSPGNDDDLHSIQMARFDSAGSQLAEFQVNQDTYRFQWIPSVAAGVSGGFEVLWVGNSSDEDSAFPGRGRRIDTMGTIMGDEFQLNTYTSGQLDEPDLATAPSGEMLAIWQYRYFSPVPPGGLTGIAIRGRRLDAAGLPISADFQINEASSNTAYEPAIASMGDRGFVVTWGGARYGYPGSGVVARRFDSAGVPLNGQIVVKPNVPGSDTHLEPATASVTPNEFVVVWSAFVNPDPQTPAFFGILLRHVQESPDLALIKSGVGTAFPGAVVTFELLVTNVGSAPSTGGLVTDSLPGDLEFEGSSDCLEAFGVVTCSFGQVLPGQNVFLEFETRVAEYVKAGTLITNSASVAGNEPDSPGNNSDDSTLLVLDPSIFIDGFESGDTSQWSVTVN